MQLLKQQYRKGGEEEKKKKERREEQEGKREDQTLGGARANRSFYVRLRVTTACYWEAAPSRLVGNLVLRRRKRDGWKGRKERRALPTKKKKRGKKEEMGRREGAMGENVGR